jgi:phosphoribosylformylglycinamidine synthase subunit PurS
MYLAKVFISYKDGILDPAGAAVTSALHSLGWTEAGNVHIGKYITLQVQASSSDEAEKKVKAMSNKLLANPIIEKYQIEVEKIG